MTDFRDHGCPFCGSFNSTVTCIGTIGEAKPENDPNFRRCEDCGANVRLGLLYRFVQRVRRNERSAISLAVRELEDRWHAEGGWHSEFAGINAVKDLLAEREAVS